MQMPSDIGKGAPARVTEVTLTIDGISIGVPVGTSIMHAAARMGNSSSWKGSTT